MPNSITIPSRDGGSFKAYVAWPKKLPAPTIILVQEIFGVNAEMREKCDKLAAQGFIAVCPDLFWRIEPGVQLTDKTPAEWEKAFDFYKRFDRDKGLEDLRCVFHAFRGHADSTGRVGVLGYCLGGFMAYMMAAHSGTSATVGYYGVGIETVLEDAARIQAPLMLHIAEKDKFVPPEAQQKIKDGLGGNKFVTLHSYAGVDHAFARGAGEHYDANAATLADGRTLAFFKENLKL